MNGESEGALSAQARILLVEDEPATRDLHAAVLQGAGFSVEMAASLAEMLEWTARTRFDLILLDLRLPDGNALDLVGQLRQNSSAGIIVATSSRSLGDRMSGLEQGADDYLEKPIHPRELVARVRNLASRLASIRSDVPKLIYHFEGWHVDLTTRKIEFHTGDTLHLTENEFRLAEILVREAPSPLHRDRLLGVLSDDEETTARAVDKAIYRMRTKFHSVLGGSAPFIETMHGFGYRLIARQL